MNDKCRLCGNSDQNLVNIFERNRKFPNLQLRICINLQIRISVADRLSHFICPLCYVKLEEFDGFIKQSQKTQFILLNADDTDLPPIQELISTTDVKCVPLCTDLQSIDRSYESIEELVEENEHEIPFKRRKLSPVFQNDDAVLEENQEIEIDLDDYYENDTDNESTHDDSNHNAASEKLPLSKLVSFFSSRVHVNKSDLNLNPIIDQEVEANSNKVDTIDHIITEIKCEKIESENISSENDSVNDEVYVKKENETSHKRIEPRKYNKIPKLKSSNLKSCPLCAHEFAPNEIEEHIRFHSDDQDYLDLIIAEMKEVPFKHKTHYCEECKKVFVRDSLYVEHKKDHLKIKMINCHLCDHTFSVRKKLKVHLRAVHIPKNNKCDLCSYAAKTYPDLQKHIKGVHEFQPIICEICGKSVSCNMSNYNRHLQTHSEERPYKCELCDSSYKTAASLQKHRNNIHFPKSVMCTACGTICGSQIKYKKHVRRCRKRMQRYC